MICQKMKLDPNFLEVAVHSGNLARFLILFLESGQWPDSSTMGQAFIWGRWVLEGALTGEMDSRIRKEDQEFIHEALAAIEAKPLPGDRLVLTARASQMAFADQRAAAERIRRFFMDLHAYANSVMTGEVFLG